MPRNVFQVTVNLPASFRNNVNNNEVFNPYVFVRNRLYHFVFHRFALVYARFLSDVHRKLIEFLILLASLFCFITLIYVHVVFVQTPMTCLDSYKDVWQRNGILRVEVLSGKKKENYTLQDSYWKEKTLRLQHFDGQSYYFYSEQTVKEESTVKDISEDIVIIGNNVSLKGDILDDNVLKNSIFMKSNEIKEDEEDSTNDSEIEKVGDETNLQPILEESIIAANMDGAYIMEFSLEYGFLRLRPSKRRDLNISVTFVVLDPEVDECFGGSFNRFLLDNFLGYDNVLLASIKKMAEKKDQKGFVRNAVMDIEYIFINNWTNEKSYITAGFVMIIFTLTISTLLRHSHHQIFVVVANFFDVVWPRNLIPSSGAPVLTVILALVGMEAVMSDFFHDRSIALYVIIIVWFADLYDAVCCQSALSKRHWFRFFYLYHFLFYAYNYKFGGVYWPLTLTTSWLFTLHSMVFFFHHYELPRFLHRAARMTAAHEARNPRPHNNPPDNSPPPNQEPEQPDGNQPDDDSGGRAADTNESTPEPENDQGSAGNDREGSVDRSESTDQSGSTDLSGFNNQSGFTDHSWSNNQTSFTDQSSSTGQKISMNESGSTDSPSFTNLCSSTDKTFYTNQFACADHKGSMYQSNFVYQFSSTNQSSTINQFGSTDPSGSTCEPGCKNSFDSTDQYISIDKSSSRNQTGSIDKYILPHNFGNAGLFLPGQYDSTDQTNSINQSKYEDRPFTEQFISLYKHLSIGNSSSTYKSMSTDNFQTKDQSRCIDEYKEVSLVPKSSTLAIMAFCLAITKCLSVLVSIQALVTVFYNGIPQSHTCQR